MLLEIFPERPIETYRRIITFRERIYAFPTMKQRKATRLKDYDYSTCGFYFVTICTKDGKEWFGEIESGEMIFSRSGRIAEKCWIDIPAHFKHVKLDEFIVMPNHVHGIVNIVGNAYMRSLPNRTKMLLSSIVQQYKSSVTRKIRYSCNHNRFQWQKSFYDHIIRTERSFNNIREYIKYNPLKWESDIENTININMSDREYYRKILNC